MTPSKTATKKPAPKKTAKPAGATMTLASVMQTLEKAGTAQARKTYTRHGAEEPMFGVSFAFLKTLHKKIGVDHDLARELWDTGNFDARNLAMKIADPARITSAELDRWARDTNARMVCGYIAMIAQESPLATKKAAQWLAGKKLVERCAAWGLVGQMASRDEAVSDKWFGQHLVEIERSIHAASDAERYAMNGAVIAIGGRSSELRKAALAAAKRIGKVEVDHGDTDCKTPDAGVYIEKAWTHAKAKGFESPAAQERDREVPRLRC